MTFTVVGSPVTKKNSPRILRGRGGKPFVAPSAKSVTWEQAAILQLQAQLHRYDGKAFLEGQRWNLRATVYRSRNVGDLGNYLSAVCDALERAGVVENDRYITGFDGSRLLIDRANPRVEIELTEIGAP